MDKKIFTVNFNIAGNSYQVEVISEQGNKNAIGFNNPKNFSEWWEVFSNMYNCFVNKTVIN